MSIEVLDRPPERLTVPSTDKVSSPGTRLSVIVPAYREAKRIADNLRRLLNELDALGTPYEVIVVSDGNTDDTVREAETVISPNIKVVQYNVNMGKGYALRCGVSRSSGELVTFIDADMELDPRYIKPFLAVMDGFDCDAVIGSKRHPMSNVSYPAFRRFQSSIYQLLIRLLFRLNVRDTQTGLKLFKRQVLEEVVPLLAIKRFAFDLELLVVARRLGYRKIMEAPVDLNYRFESTVDPKAAWRVLWDTAAIFYRCRIRKYYDRPTSSSGLLLSGQQCSQISEGATPSSRDDSREG
jgi:glycosyltransferase involved in cell wall biosynthesis